MKNHYPISPPRAISRACLGLLLLLMAIGAHAKDKPDKIHYRGWIGGNFTRVHVFPAELREKTKAGFLITSLSTNTPAAIAGLHEGDLVLELNDQPVKSLRKFNHAIDIAQPGALLKLKAWHEGKVSGYEVRVGRESFTHNGVFVIGVPGFFHGFEWPSGAGFSLGPLGFERESVEDRVELSSTEETYYKRCDAKSHEATDADWSAWLVVFQASTHKTIKAQEVQPADKGL